MDSLSSKTKGQRFSITIPRPLLVKYLNRHLLKTLLTNSAGFETVNTGKIYNINCLNESLTVAYFVGGNGWVNINGDVYTIKSGDLLLLYGVEHWTCSAHTSLPVVVYYAELLGELIPAFLEEFKVDKHIRIIRSAQDLQLQFLFQELIHSLAYGLVYENLLEASALAMRILAIAIKKLQSSSETSKDVDKIARSIIYMSEHINEHLQICDLARLVNLSQPHFTVLFKVQTGCAPRDYLNLLRMHKACELLLSSDLSVKEVAAKVGYTDQFHFSRKFKKFYGISPVQYRKKV